MQQKTVLRRKYEAFALTNLKYDLCRKQKNQNKTNPEQQDVRNN